MPLKRDARDGLLELQNEAELLIELVARSKVEVDEVVALGQGTSQVDRHREAARPVEFDRPVVGVDVNPIKSPELASTMAIPRSWCCPASRPDHEVREEVLDCHYVRLRSDAEGDERQVIVEHDGTERPFLDLLGEADIIVNGIFQDPDQPMMFVTEAETSRLKRGCLIIDVSCDEGKGFSFAKPTTFDDPMFKVGSIDYYAVDHTPSYLWESASRSISAALIVHLPTVLAGREAWNQKETVRRAVVIDQGVIQKPEILSFQGRATQYPHEVLR